VSVEVNDMNKRILIALTSHDRKGDTGEPTGAYLPEVAHPWEVFRRAGFDVDFASVKGGKVPIDGKDARDAAVDAFKNSEAYAELDRSMPSSAIDPARYDAIFFAGGHGTMWDFASAESFAKAARVIYEKGGVVSAVCHGAAALVNVTLSDGAQLVRGRDVTAFTNEEERAVKLENVVPFLLEDALREKGARVVTAPKWQPHVIVSERLVTGQNPASAKGVAEAVTALLTAR
jgi:putative intracellular protease/amidase